MARTDEDEEARRHRARALLELLKKHERITYSDCGKEMIDNLLAEYQSAIKATQRPSTASEP